MPAGVLPVRHPQLFMVRADLRGLPELTVPAPYRIRAYRDGDEAAWAEIMNTGIGSGWDAEGCRDLLIRRAQFRADGLFFAVRDANGEEAVVGTTCAWRSDPEEWETGSVHMVCVRPADRGLRLGYWLTLAALRWFRDHGFRRAVLSTDDFRVSAIRAYLALGFVPWLNRPGHLERWEAVLGKIAG